MKKILIFGMTNGYGGIESFVMGIFRHFPKDQYEFHFVKTDDHIAYEEELLEAGVNIYHITPRHENARNHYKEMERLFQIETYDIVWTNRCMLNSIAELKYAKKYGCPIRIMHAHSSKNTGGKVTQFMHDWNKHQLHKYCTLKFSCSSEATAYFFGNEQDVHLIKNGLNVNQYLYDHSVDIKTRKELGLEDAFIVGHVGRFTFEKNQKFAISAFQDVAKQISNATLLLCGKGPLLEECRSYAKELGLEHSVRFLGEVQNVPEILQSMNVFIFPSIFEGLPYAALEAQFSGAKCLISKHVSHEVIIREDSELLEIDDPKLWAEAIIKNHNYEKRRCEELRNSPFTIESTCDHILQLLNGSNIGKDGTVK